MRALFFVLRGGLYLAQKDTASEHVSAVFSQGGERLHVCIAGLGSAPEGLQGFMQAVGTHLGTALSGLNAKLHSIYEQKAAQPWTQSLNHIKACYRSENGKSFAVAHSSLVDVVEEYKAAVSVFGFNPNDTFNALL